MVKKEHNELEKRNLAFLIYQDENETARVNVRFYGIEEQYIQVLTEKGVVWHVRKNPSIVINNNPFVDRLRKPCNNLQMT